MEYEKQYLLYDEDCGLCKWYTATFVKYGFLQKDARLPYHKGVEDQGFDFDIERAKNEIALVSRDSKNVFYGVDSLLHILGRRWKWVESVGHFLPIYLFLKMLYKLISLNRKVISPATCTTGCDCNPSMSTFWRITFIVLSGIITGVIVGNYFVSELGDYLRFHFAYLDMLFFIAQIGFQYLFFRLFKQKDFFTYAGHIAVISLIGAVALGIIQIGLHQLGSIGIDIALLQTAGYGMVLGIMLLEHARRVKLLGHTTWLTVTWMIFRLLIYPIAFTL